MQFTGKERDAETGLDYFGARYFSGPQGRFTSADPSGISIDRTNPQSWNRYAYTYNTPLKLVDRNGMWPSPTHDEIYHQALPGLPAVQLALVQRASRSVDAINNQFPNRAYRHGMSAPGQEKGEARKQADAWILKQEHKASELQQRHENEGGKGFSDAALSQFALAAHTVSDRTSPSHAGEQVWQNPVTHPNEVSPHNAGESNATDEQIKAAVEAVRQAFIEAFGARKAQEAFGNEQQTPPKNTER